MSALDETYDSFHALAVEKARRMREIMGEAERLTREARFFNATLDCVKRNQKGDQGAMSNFERRLDDLERRTLVRDEDPLASPGWREIFRRLAVFWGRMGETDRAREYFSKIPRAYLPPEALSLIDGETGPGHSEEG